MAPTLSTAAPEAPVERRAGPPDLHGNRLRRGAPAAVLAGSAVVGSAGTSALGGGVAACVVVSWLVFVVALQVVSRRFEERRHANDRLATTLIVSAFGLALLPLVSLLWVVISRGAGQLSAQFFTYSMRNVVGAGGGIYHAIIGTVLITLVAAVMSVPIGLFTAIYLVEYGPGRRLAAWITFLVDVMTGIPSIVAGLFAYALFAIFLGDGTRTGFAGAVALSALMIPIVVRSSEEMLKLVPNELREAAYALGVPRWRTIVKVVLPTSLAGIVTGVTLAIARVIGETAPLLITAGYTLSTNTNLFGGRMMTLPVFAYQSYKQPGVPPQFGYDRGWGAALVLMLIVMVLNLAARLVSYFLSPARSSRG
ncbi:MAG: phosphate ABC transporter permease PstA [Nocardioidaceae bacterium]